MTDATPGAVSQALVGETAAGTRRVVRIPVTKTLGGTAVELTTQVVRGAADGPVLMVLGGMHGDETGSLPIIGSFVEQLDPAGMRGTVIAVPVANPLAWQAMSRFTPELHGTTDLHAVFPGNRRGTMTQMIAAALSQDVLALLGPDDLFVDLHSGGAGGRLQCRVDFDYRVEGRLRERVTSLCRVFGTALLHENDLRGTATTWLNARGVPTVNVEMGGGYLDPAASELFEQRGTDGLRRLGVELGVLEGEPTPERQQRLFDRPSRIEVNPTVGGYLESEPAVASAEALGTELQQGTLLGRMIDPYTLVVLEELRAPVDGFLFFSRYSGSVEAGSKVYGIAAKETSTWL